jgi:hypothetical protein
MKKTDSENWRRTNTFMGLGFMLSERMFSTRRALL